MFFGYFVLRQVWAALLHRFDGFLSGCQVYFKPFPPFRIIKNLALYARVLENIMYIMVAESLDLRHAILQNSAYSQFSVFQFVCNTSGGSV